MSGRQLDSDRLQRVLQAIMAKRETMPDWVRQGLGRRISHVSIEIASGYVTIYYVDFDNQQTATIGDYLPPELLRDLTAWDAGAGKDVA